MAKLQRTQGTFGGADTVTVINEVVAFDATGLGEISADLAKIIEEYPINGYDLVVDVVADPADTTPLKPSRPAPIKATGAQA